MCWSHNHIILLFHSLSLWFQVCISRTRYAFISSLTFSTSMSLSLQSVNFWLERSWRCLLFFVSQTLVRLDSLSFLVLERYLLLFYFPFYFILVFYFFIQFSFWMKECISCSLFKFSFLWNGASASPTLLVVCCLVLSRKTTYSEWWMFFYLVLHPCFLKRETISKEGERGRARQQTLTVHGDIQDVLSDEERYPLF